MTDDEQHHPVVRSFATHGQYRVLADGRTAPVPENWEIICPQCGDDGRPHTELPSPEHWPEKLRRLRGPWSVREMAFGIAQAHMAKHATGTTNAI